MALPIVPARRDSRAAAALLYSRTMAGEGQVLNVDEALSASVRDPRLIQAGLALVEGRLAVAERLLRPHLKEKPTDIAAIRMMAELAGRLGRYKDAEALLRRALELAPDFTAARANLATVLYRQNRAADALEVLDSLLDGEPENPPQQNLRAAALGRLGAFEEALRLYEQVLAKTPDQPKVWMSYGHTLKTVGRLEEGVAAYRRALALVPMLGEAWWSLANLKTVAFADDDLAAMESALAGGRLKPEDRFHLHFALGKALEERRDPERAFAHYAEGNRLRHDMMGYDPEEVTSLVRRTRQNTAFGSARRPTMRLCAAVLVALFIAGTAAAAPGDATVEEARLANLVNDYRRANGLPAVPLSRSLTLVAQLHARDLELNRPATGHDGRGRPCNLHSWSASGPWQPFCYTDDHRYSALMWSKPREITRGAYPGNGFEIAAAASYAMSAPAALRQWQGSAAHNSVILQKGKWGQPWRAMGIGIHGGYAVIWFGREADMVR